MGLKDKQPFKVIESNQSEKGAVEPVKKNKQKTKASETPTQKSKTKKTFKAIVGILLIALTVSIYMQGLPLIIIFLGGMLGIPATGGAASEDMLVWGVSGIGVAGLVTYGLIKLCGVIWHGMVRRSAK